ncbi:MAG: hypothetical protein ACRYFX_28340 [Janthinobacterium lividum]
MKRLFATLLCLLTFTKNQAQTKAYVDQKTKAFSLTANIRQDHQFFGYAAPSVKAKRLILFSIFTNAIKGNPYKCPLGAYYDTSGLKTEDTIRYVSATRNFVKLQYMSATKGTTPFYVQRRFVSLQ